jgi:hypothetical protein
MKQESQSGQPSPPPESLVRLFDESSGGYKQVPVSEAAATLQDPNARMGFKTGDSYYFQYPDGGLGKATDVNSFYEALKAGGKEIDERTAMLRKEAKGTLGTLTAFGSGAASSATFGLSDVAARGLDELTGGKLGITERIKASQEANPFATGAGQVAGAIGSAVLLPGGGLVGQAGKLAAGAVERAAGSQLASLAAKGTLGGIASAGARLGATGAIEGVAQGVGQTISQQALQSTPMGPVESLVANVGTGLLFGGAIGGALGAGVTAAAPVVKGIGKSFVTGAGMFKGDDALKRQAYRNIFEQGTDEAYAFRQYDQYKKELGDQINTALEAKDPVRLEQELSAKIDEQFKGLDTTALKADLQKQAQKFVELNNPKILKDELEGSVTRLFNQSEAKGKEISVALNKELGLDTVDEEFGKKAFRTVADHIDRMESVGDLNPATMSKLQELKNRITPLDDATRADLQQIKQNYLNRLERTDVKTERTSLESSIEMIDRRLNQGNPVEALTQLRDIKREVFALTREAKSKMATPEAKVIGQQLEGLNTVLKDAVWDPALFGDNAIKLEAFDNAMARMLSSKDKLKKANVLGVEGNLGYSLKNDVVKKFLKDPKNANIFEDYLQANKDLQEMAMDLGVNAVKDFMPQGGVRSLTSATREADKAFLKLKDMGLVSKSEDGFILSKGGVDKLLKNPEIDSLITDIRGEGLRGTRAVLDREAKLQTLINEKIIKKQGNQFVLNESGIASSLKGERLGAVLDDVFDDPKIRNLVEETTKSKQAFEELRYGKALTQQDGKYVAAESQINKLVADEDLAAQLGTQLGESGEQITKKLETARNVKSLWGGESFTGKSLLTGGIAGAVFGPKAGALVAALENPGMVTKFLTKVYDGSLKLGKQTDNPWFKSVVSGMTVNYLSDVAREAQTQQVQTDAQASIEKTSQAIDRAAQGLMYQDPKAAFQPSQTSKPLTVKEFQQTVASLNTPQGFDSLDLPAETKASLMVSRDLAKNFLESKLPPKRVDDLGLDQPPTAPQLAKWSRYYSAVNDPLGVFKDMEKGYVSPEGLEALKTVYPALYSAMQEQVRGTLKDDPKPRNKLLVATVLGGQMSPTTRANALAASQTWALAQEEAGGVGGVAQGMGGVKGGGVKFPAPQTFEPLKRGGMV